VSKRLPILRLAVVTAVVLVPLAAAALGLRFWGRPAAAAEGPQFHRQQAEPALRAGDFGRAVEHLQHCLESWPAHAETRFLLARACRRADDPEGWQRHLRAAEALQWPAADIAFERQLGDAQLGRMAGVEPALLDRLESGAGDNDLIFEALVKGYLLLYRLPDAAFWAARWLEESPDSWQAWLYRGRAHHLNRVLGPAAAEYRRALEIKPDLRPGRLWLAGVLTLNGEHAEALPQYEAYVRDYPDDAAGLLGLANCHYELNHPAEAEAALIRLLARQPDNVAALLVRARLELARAAPAEALVWLKKAEAVAPDEGDILIALDQAYRQAGRPDEARPYQKRLENARQQTRRLEELQQQILRRPGDVGPRREAGVLTLRLGRLPEALGWLTGALALDPDHRPTHEALAEYYEKVGDARRAEYHRSRAAGP
jgi:tetratricopeptide (TPR) repeat protein